MDEQSKSFIFSKGIMFGIVALITSSLGIFMEEDDIFSTIENVDNIVASIAILISIYGRATAKKKITL